MPSTQKTIVFDAAKCFGCHACSVACMDQNDIDIQRDGVMLRRVADVEQMQAGEVRIAHVSLACMHCADAGCIDACPSRALTRDFATGAVVVRRELCIGCRACAMACPFGVPRFGAEGTLMKCDGCFARTRFGERPACVDICPGGALTYEDINKVMDCKERKYGASLM